MAVCELLSNNLAKGVVTPLGFVANFYGKIKGVISVGVVDSFCGELGEAPFFIVLVRQDDSIGLNGCYFLSALVVLIGCDFLILCTRSLNDFCGLSMRILPRIENLSFYFLIDNHTLLEMPKLPFSIVKHLFSAQKPPKGIALFDFSLMVECILPDTGLMPRGRGSDHLHYRDAVIVDHTIAILNVSDVAQGIFNADGALLEIELGLDGRSGYLCFATVAVNIVTVAGG